MQASIDRTSSGDVRGLAALFADHAVIEDPIGSPPIVSLRASWGPDDVEEITS